MNRIPIISDIVERWAAPMPKFFQIIFWISAAISFLHGLFVYASGQLEALGIARPDWFTTAAGWVALGAAIVSKLTVDWKKLQAQEVLSNIKKA